PMVNKDGIIEFSVWVPYLAARDQELADSPRRLVDTQLSSQSAAIAATPLTIGTNAGLYRLTVYARITRAATVSSSLTPTLRWTEGGVPLSHSFTALTGNTTTTYLAEDIAVRIDSTTSVTYETAYVSSGATTMAYSLEICAER